MVHLTILSVNMCVICVVRSPEEVSGVFYFLFRGNEIRPNKNTDLSFPGRLGKDIGGFVFHFVPSKYYFVEILSPGNKNKI